MGALGSKDFWAGVMFIAFGLAFVLLGHDYSMGTSVRMGPAYFPTVLGALLTLLGALIGGRSFLALGARLGHFALRPVILVLVSVVLFAVALEPLGLVVATFLLIFVGALAGSEFRWKETAGVYLILIAFSIVVFHYGLGMTFPLWPAFMQG
jgi:putative tricarboxylic transport membrane protein